MKPTLNERDAVEDKVLGVHSLRFALHISCQPPVVHAYISRKTLKSTLSESHISREPRSANDVRWVA